MRTIWLLGGVLGLSAVATNASASIQFTTVINEGDTVAGTGGDTFANAIGVVVGPDGSVGISGSLENSGNSDVIYATPNGSGGWNNQSVVEASTPTPVVGLGPTAQFGSFDNIAITGIPAGAGQTLTFAATAAVGSNAGILQWDSSTSTLSNVAFDGDGKGYSSIGSSNPDSGAGLVEMQVNSFGQVIFPAIVAANPPASQSVIVEGNSAAVATVFTSNSTLTNSVDPGSRLGIGTDGTGAALLSKSGTPGIYQIPAITTSTPISGTFTPSNLANPILGYASGGGFNGAVMLVNTGGGQSNIVLESTGGTPHSIAANGPFTIPGGDVAQGQMTPNGQVALYVPSTTGDTIQYADATSGNPDAKVIASIGSALADTSQTIQALSSPGETWGPEINSGGTILFQAEVGTDPSDEQEALLLALPGQTPQILLEANQQIDIDGNPVTINDMLLNDLSDDYNYNKNALNDQNDVAVYVDYTDQSGDSGSAVLYTAVPEPSTIAILSLASAGLMARRRRRSIA